MRFITLNIFIFIRVICFTQAENSLFLEDQFRGGVSFSGYGFGYSGATTATSELHIEPGSTIRKAYLFYAVQIYPNTGISDLLSPFNMNVNSIPICLDTLNPLFINERFIAGSFDEWTYYSLYAIDITNIIQPTDTEITYEIPLQPVGNNKYKFFCTYVLYENPVLPLINTCIYLNHEKMMVPMVYDLNQHNKMNLTNPISLSTVVEWSVSIEDGYFMYVNEDSIGLTGGDDLHTSGPAGALTSGQFYHQNNAIYGLDDDTPDMIMDSSDALANIQTYITDPNEFQLTFDYSGGYEPTHGVTFEDFPDGLSNGIWMMLVNYSPACDATNLDVVFTDTTICKGSNINLNASGGAKYKWQPATFLDCDTCATPVCTPQNSQWYTCTITTADSCSKTIPVFVGVYEPPKITTLVIKGDTCGLDAGAVTAYVNGAAPYVYRLNSWAQTEQTFTNLKGGAYSLTVTDVYGCSTDTNLVVPLHNNVTAGFKIDKAIGEAPLTINLTDQSINATNWEWYIANDTLFTQNPSYIFEENDTFSVMQVVYNTYPECADTAITRVMVFKPIEVHIPNVFTPNQDQTNEDFFITLTGGEFIQWNIYNRWGQRVAQGEKEITLDQQDIYLWDGIDINSNLPAADGVYFYDIVIRTPADVVRSFSGNLTVLCTRC
jgi:gliding motility-associated-like protein